MGERAQGQSSRHPWRRARHASTLSAFAEFLLLGVALLVGFGLVVVFAATLALAMTFATVLLGLTALSWQLRRRAPKTVPVRRGHAWVGYDWDRH